MKTCIISFLALILAVGGCIVVSPAAETILTVERPGDCDQDKSVMGLRDVHWFKTEDKLSIVGYGWHPREHETYAFLICEPYPACLRRYIRVTSEYNKSKTTQPCKVELLIHPFLLPCGSAPWEDPSGEILYVGTTSCRIGTFFGKHYLNLQDVKLTRAAKSGEFITVSGRIAAKKASPTKRDYFPVVLQRFDPAHQADPDKILEQGLVEMFRLLAQNNAGKFPSASNTNIMQEIKAQAESIRLKLHEQQEPSLEQAERIRSKMPELEAQLKKSKKPVQKEKILQQWDRQVQELDKIVERIHESQRKNVGPINRGILFLRALSNYGDWRYSGRGASLGDANTIIFRYRLQTSQTCRLIYGDLTIKDVPLENLAKQSMVTE